MEIVQVTIFRKYSCNSDTRTIKSGTQMNPYNRNTNNNVQKNSGNNAHVTGIQEYLVLML